MSRSVLVTGAGTGIGLETSLLLASRQYTVYAAYFVEHQKKTIEDAARERRVSVETVEMDITDPVSVDKAVARIVKETGSIYGLVNNAGVSLRGFFEDIAEAEAQEIFRVNVFGTMVATRAVLPHMRSKREGRIIFITSVGGRIGSPGVSIYCATKFAQEGFSESLMQEVKPFGIRVVLVEPGIVKTERWGVHRVVARASADPDSPYHAMFKKEETIALRMAEKSRITPSDVANRVHAGLSKRNPKLRYVVGPYARVVLFLRRYLPNRLFEKLYFGSHIRWITQQTAEDTDSCPEEEKVKP